MNPIRVHLGPMPELLRTIVRDMVSQEPDMLIVGNSACRTDCIREAREERADIVVARDSLEDDSSCLDLLLARPPLGVLVVSADGQSASGVSLARRPMPLGSGRPVLAGAIRRLAAELGAAPVAPQIDSGSPADEQGQDDAALPPDGSTS